MLYHASCIEGAKQYLENDSVDLLIADPPYNLQFGGTTQTKDKKPRFDVFPNDRLSPQAYQRFCMQWIYQAYRILKPGRHAYVFIDWRTYPDMVRWLRLAGFIIKNCIVWDKAVMGMGWQYRYQHELIIFAVKGEKRVRKVSSRRHSDVWRIPRIPGNRTAHPTEKPIELLKQIIELSSEAGEYVVDFFSGSGVAPVAAIELNRNWTAFELDEKWFEFSSNRINKTDTAILGD
ncbi:site-specific DNA-methyltransferase (adenine-specific)/modification methylase [Paenibacillus cellulosilyticus]|uniref:Methyltransferase n=1 Tax=Paenibacillus cellulosilyticus TaxID=375489 RepID=A0A2V2YTN3_9BACL|nr:site-specific DNA-methyltransferase [Paenibacillus cellulosilyticus]PWW01196.1 site-specific DNA-methyltransferase (adenine-specific)/modification methylase [Paenibacillus cellulosilyticus]QKS46849.1 site-specific DNA-methyltransferase [Paenibacillus cellulosilyticus]